MKMNSIPHRFSAWMQAHALDLLRYGIGLVFVWFGAPKLVPGLSPAEGLVAATVSWCDASWFVPLLGAAEVLIGLCLWSRTLIPLGLLLLSGHMCGTVLPLFTLPDVTWKMFPVATLEGQYIIKNVVLVAGAFVIASANMGSIESWIPGLPRFLAKADRRPVSGAPLPVVISFGPPSEPLQPNSRVASSRRDCIFAGQRPSARA